MRDDGNSSGRLGTSGSDIGENRRSSGGDSGDDPDDNRSDDGGA
jgi:hypothetical protein